MTGYAAKIAARANMAGSNHVNYQYGASNRFQTGFNSYPPLFQYGYGYGQPQMTAYTHENTRTYNGHGFLGKIFGGAFDFIKSAVGAATGTQIGGYKDTWTQSGGYPTGCYGNYTNMNISGYSGGWGQQLGQLAGTAFGASQQYAQQNQSVENPEITKLKGFYKDYTFVEDNGKIIARNDSTGVEYEGKDFDSIRNSINRAKV